MFTFTWTVRVKSINYTDLKKKKKPIQRTVEACSIVHWTVEAKRWRHASTVSKKKMFSEQWTEFGRVESSNLLLSVSLRLARNKLGDPCTVNSFFFLTKHLLSAFLKKRNLYLVAKRALRIPQINIVTTLLYWNDQQYG